MFKMRWKWCIC